MIQCTQCGKENADQTQFCRFCGNRLGMTPPFPQPQAPEQTYAPPRPYAWKTDEYQTQSERRIGNAPRTQPLYNNAPVHVGAQPLAFAGQHYMVGNYRCPNCGTATLPIVERRISTAGWITFALLLVFTLIFFWIGLLMKENVTICPICRATLS
ncbi:MAG: LITAF-like zinc ribbon domain-containing protein [Pyrinomonadaceae bacterium]